MKKLVSMAEGVITSTNKAYDYVENHNGLILFKTDNKKDRYLTKSKVIEHILISPKGADVFEDNGVLVVYIKSL